MVTLRGKKYELAAATVEELQKEMEARSGLKPGQQVCRCMCIGDVVVWWFLASSVR